MMFISRILKKMSGNTSSTAINTVKKKRNVKVHITYDENNELVVDCTPKQDFSLHFLK